MGAASLVNPGSLGADETEKRRSQRREKFSHAYERSSSLRGKAPILRKPAGRYSKISVRDAEGPTGVHKRCDRDHRAWDMAVYTLEVYRFSGPVGGLEKKSAQTDEKGDNVL